jgi:hypothetical protein
VANPSDADARAFADTRKALLEALDRTEQDANDQASEVVRRAERRAHEIIVESDQCAALIEEQLTYLTDQIEHVRLKVSEIRARLAREAKSDKNVITAQAPIHPRPPGPPQAQPSYPTPPPLSPQPSGQPAPPSYPAQPQAPDEDTRWKRPSASPDDAAFPPDPSQPAPPPAGADSLHETLRTLRSALESLSGQPPGHQ